MQIILWTNERTHQVEHAQRTKWIHSECVLVLVCGCVFVYVFGEFVCEKVRKCVGVRRIMQIYAYFLARFS